jgi:predicted nucleic acid-binding protein
MSADLVLVDTSVWIDFFNRRPVVVAQIGALRRKAAICGAVKQEVLQGSRNDQMFATIESGLSVCHYLAEQPEDFVSAARIYSKLRKTGFTLPPQDCLIAAVAIRNDVQLYANDRHFERVDGLSVFHFDAR